MALNSDFPESPFAILEPVDRWFPADEALRESSMDRLMLPLVSQLRRRVREWRDSGCAGAADTSKSLLKWSERQIGNAGPGSTGGTGRV